MAHSARFIDMNGYLLVKGCPVSSPGIFDYSAAQCGETEEQNNGDINRIVKVYRPEASVSDPEFIETLKLVPFIDEHTFLTGDTSVIDEEDGDPGMDPSDKGVDGVMTNEVYYEAPWLRADLKIFSRAAQDAMRNGKTDLSLGYISHFEYDPGVYQGQPYDYIQTTMRGNHIALVGTGRVPGARVLDGLVFDSLSFTVPSTTTKESAMDEDTKAQLMSSLDALCASAPGATDPAVTPAAAAAAPAQPAKDESNLENNEHQREAGAAIGVDDVIAKLEATAKHLRESAGEKAHNAAEHEKIGDEGGDNELTLDSENGLPVGDEDPGLAHERERKGMLKEEKTGDAVDGLREDGTAELTLDNDEIVKASKGPAAGTQKVGDAALRSFHADLAARDRIVARAKPLIGVFTADSMTATDASQYVAKKLKINVPRNLSRLTMDAYFMGVEAGKKLAAKSAPATATAQRVGDSAVDASMADYLKPRS